MAGVLEDMSRLLYSGVEPEFLDLLQTWFAVDCRIGAEVKIGSSGKCPHCKESLQSVELDNKELGILVREMEQVVINYMDGRESASSTQSNVFADGRTHQGIRYKPNLPPSLASFLDRLWACGSSAGSAGEMKNLKVCAAPSTSTLYAMHLGSWTGAPLSCL